jgi:hypothetical protein
MRTVDKTLNPETNAHPFGEGHTERLRTTVIASVLVVSVALNVLLARKVRQFNGEQSAARAERLVKVGTPVPPITAKKLGGGNETISYSESHHATVLYVFTPQCVWCQRNLDNLKTLIKEKRGEYRFIAISLAEDGVQKYVAEIGLDIPVYTGISAEARKAYKMGSTPETITVSSEGKVMQAWAGAYVGEPKLEVESYFHVTLPGITADSH